MSSRKIPPGPEDVSRAFRPPGPGGAAAPSGRRGSRQPPRSMHSPGTTPRERQKKMPSKRWRCNVFRSQAARRVLFWERPRQTHNPRPAPTKPEAPLPPTQQARSTPPPRNRPKQTRPRQRTRVVLNYRCPDQPAGRGNPTKGPARPTPHPGGAPWRRNACEACV